MIARRQLVCGLISGIPNGLIETAIKYNATLANLLCRHFFSSISHFLEEFVARLHKAIQMAFIDAYPTPSATPPNGVFASGVVRFPFIVLASSRAVLSGRFTAATIVISLATGKITSVYDSVLPSTDFPLGTPYVDYSPHFILPGLVDSHVHLNEPGRTEWEGFWTGTRAAAFGGVTTVIDMPLNAIPPTTTVDGLKQKVAAAQGKCWVDVGFYGGIVPGNERELKGLVKAGVKGFKGFLIDSGVRLVAA